MHPDSKVGQDYGKQCQQIKLLDHIDKVATIENALFMMETSGIIHYRENKLYFSVIISVCD